MTSATLDGKHVKISKPMLYQQAKDVTGIARAAEGGKYILEPDHDFEAHKVKGKLFGESELELA
jgi:hypothetical protein